MTSSIAMLPADDEALIETCRQKSLELLRTNLTPQGILAATPAARADVARLCGDLRARRRGVRDRHGALRRRAAGARSRDRPGDARRVSGDERPDPKIRRSGPARSRLLVPRLHRRHAVVADRARLSRRPRPGRRAAAGLAPNVAKAIQWLEAQEHQRFFLLQQNEASDWADIMPRSGFVLYTNALWYCVKQLYRPRAHRGNAGEFQPAVSSLLRRAARIPARAPADALREARGEAPRPLSRPSSTSPSSARKATSSAMCSRCCADSPTSEAARRTLRALDRARIAEPWPVRVVCEPIPRQRPAVAGLHVAPPAEPRVAIPQRRHLAVRRRLLGRCAGAGGRRRQGARGTGEARGRQCARRLGVQRMAAWPHFGAARHARPVLECRCFSIAWTPCAAAARASRCGRAKSRARMQDCRNRQSDRRRFQVIAPRVRGSMQAAKEIAFCSRTR